MLNHTMIGSNDIQRTKQFYDAVLGVLGAGPAMEHVNDTGQTRLFYIHDGSTFAFQSRLTASPQLLLMAPPSVSSATRLSNCRISRCSYRQWRHDLGGSAGSTRGFHGYDVPVLFP